MTFWKYSAEPLPCAHGAMAPWATERSGSGTSSSGSTSSSVPMPVQVGQAPNGLLNENDRGSISSIAIAWLLGQAIFSEKRRSRTASGSLSSTSTNSTSSTPAASRRAVSTESVSRRLAPVSSPLATSRSTTTSIVCLYCFSSFGGSDRETTSPSTRALENPLVCSSAKRSTNSPLRACTTGASTWNLVRSGSSSSWSTICWGLCLVIASPHTGQCGRPARANSSRR